MTSTAVISPPVAPAGFTARAIDGAWQLVDNRLALPVRRPWEWGGAFFAWIPELHRVGTALVLAEGAGWQVTAARTDPRGLVELRTMIVCPEEAICCGRVGARPLLLGVGRCEDGRGAPSMVSLLTGRPRIGPRMVRGVAASYPSRAASHPSTLSVYRGVPTPVWSELEMDLLEDRGGLVARTEEGTSRSFHTACAVRWADGDGRLRGWTLEDNFGEALTRPHFAVRGGQDIFRLGGLRPSDVSTPAAWEGRDPERVGVCALPGGVVSSFLETLGPRLVTERLRQL